MLTSTLQSMLRCMDGLYPLLGLSELWQTLQVLEVTLERNVLLAGTLGPGSPQQPSAAFPLLSLADLALVSAFYVANSTASAITRSNITALVDRLMMAAAHVGDAAAATGTYSALEPIEALKHIPLFLSIYAFYFLYTNQLNQFNSLNKRLVFSKSGGQRRPRAPPKHQDLRKIHRNHVESIRVKGSEPF